MDPAATEVGLGTPPDPLEDPLIGHVLDEKYRITGVLGAGGMSLVYEGENITIGRRVAIKVLHRHLAVHREILERFEREARTSARIRHPNIVDVLDFGRLDSGVPYIVMELLEGEALFDRLSAQGAMPVAKATQIVMTVVATLEAAHRAGVYHRDIKPENVFLARAADGSEIVKVVDFGIAKYSERCPNGPRLTLEGLAVGTPAYMSPEQAMGRDDIDGRSDLYSTGVLLYELLSNRLPHEGSLESTITKLMTEAPTNLLKLAPWVPASLALVVHKAMARRREDRYQTASELIDALRPYAERPLLADGTIALVRRKSTSRPESIVVATPKVGTEPFHRARRRLPVARLAASALAAIATLFLLGSIPPSAPQQEAAARARESGRPAPRAAVTPAALPPTVPLTVVANVAGARVLLDGRPVGTTPLDTTVPATSSVQLLVVEADRFVSAPYWIRTSSPVRLAVTLVPVQEVAAGTVTAPRTRARSPARPRLTFYQVY